MGMELIMILIITSIIDEFILLLIMEVNSVSIVFKWSVYNHFAMAGHQLES